MAVSHNRQLWNRNELSLKMVKYLLCTLHFEIPTLDVDRVYLVSLQSVKPTVQKVLSTNTHEDQPTNQPSHLPTNQPTNQPLTPTYPFRLHLHGCKDQVRRPRLGSRNCAGTWFSLYRGSHQSSELNLLEHLYSRLTVATAL